MTTTNFIVTPETLSKKETSFIGCLAQWNMKSRHQSNVEFLETAIESIGLDKVGLNKPTFKTAIGRACEQVCEEASIKDVEYNCDMIEDSKELYKYIIFEKKKNREKKEFDFANGTNVVWNKGSGKVEFTGPHAGAVEALFHIYKESYTTQDMRIYIRQQFILACGIMFHGGVYIIPNNKGCIERLNKIDELLKTTEFADTFSVTEEGKVQSVPVGVVTFAIPGGQEKIFVTSCLVTDFKERMMKIQEGIAKTTKKVGTLNAKNENIREANELLKVFEPLLDEDVQLEGLKKLVLETQNMIIAKTEELSK